MRLDVGISVGVAVHGMGGWRGEEDSGAIWRALEVCEVTWFNLCIC